MNELVFEITQEADGGFVAECLTESIFTQADTWEELRHNVREAVEGFHFDRPMVPAYIAMNPKAGVLIQGTGGLRKVRWAARWSPRRTNFESWLDR